MKVSVFGACLLRVSLDRLKHASFVNLGSDNVGLCTDCSDSHMDSSLNCDVNPMATTKESTRPTSHLISKHAQDVLSLLEGRAHFWEGMIRYVLPLEIHDAESSAQKCHLLLKSSLTKLMA